MMSRLRKHLIAVARRGHCCGRRSHRHSACVGDAVFMRDTHRAFLELLGTGRAFFAIKDYAAASYWYGQGRKRSGGVLLDRRAGPPSSTGRDLRATSRVPARRTRGSRRRGLRANPPRVRS